MECAQEYNGRQKSRPPLSDGTCNWIEMMETRRYAMQKGVEREALVESNPLKWTSKYHSIVATVWACAAPDGVNEAGLTARTLLLPVSKYGHRDATHPGLSVTNRPCRKVGWLPCETQLR